MGEGKVKLELLQYFHRNDISVGFCKIRFRSDWIRLNENVNLNFFPDLDILLQKVTFAILKLPSCSVRISNRP